MRGMRTMDAQRSSSTPPRQFPGPGTVLVRPLLLKPQWMNGLSERLLVSHYVNNYGGALRRLNAIKAHLAALDWARTPVFEINGLKREELIAASSVILHEIYFDSLGGRRDNPHNGLDEPPAELARALERDFGSVKAWRAEFTSMAKALAGGSSRPLGGLSPTGPPTTRTTCQGPRQFSRSICTSMPIISIL